MKDVTIIIGPQGSGKTILAKELVNGKKAVYTFLREQYPFCEIDLETEVVVLEGVEFPKQAELVRRIIMAPSVTVDRKNEPSFQCPRPELILTTQANISDIPADIIHRSFITFP